MFMAPMALVCLALGVTVVVLALVVALPHVVIVLVYFLCVIYVVIPLRLNDVVPATLVPLTLFRTSC